MKEKVRYTFIDLLRGWAIILMIEPHVFNTFLLPELKQTGWFSVVSFINGLIAPAFLFVSGLYSRFLPAASWAICESSNFRSGKSSGE